MGRLGMIAGLALLTFVGGCVQSGQPTSTTISPATTTSEATTASTAPEPEIGEIDATGENLPAGVYTRSGFEPPLRLELDGSWQAVQVTNGFFDVQKLVGTPDVIAVQFANVTGAMGADGVTEPVSAADAVAILEGNRNLTVIETSQSRIGGRDGSQATVENQSEGHAGVLEVPPGILGIDPERRLWMAFFDTEAGLLAVMVGGSVEKWDQALAEAEPVLESIVIGT